jgi:hypothetical protein
MGYQVYILIESNLKNSTKNFKRTSEREVSFHSGFKFYKTHPAIKPSSQRLNRLTDGD